MQTKFTSKQDKRNTKQDVKEFLAEGGQVFSFPDQGVTVAIKRPFKGAKCVNVAVAVMSKSETKFRPLMGKGIAISKLGWGNCLTFPASQDFDYIAEWVRDMVSCAE